ncbi:hypothetical protein DMA11_24410 [Marinilabiliaceae bacterium JC017]|nr:hypothetical protein DMA11_24410 [Marinilabiliaceae bacterium JC017]
MGLKKTLYYSDTTNPWTKLPKQTLDYFSGFLQTTEHTTYQNMQTKGNVTLLACMPHARRKFKEDLSIDARRSGFVLKKNSIYRKSNECRGKDS